MGSSWDRAEEFEEKERQEAKRKHRERESETHSSRVIREAEEVIAKHRRVTDTQSRLEEIFSTEDTPKGLSDKEILAIASNVETTPVFPWWLTDGVLAKDVRERTLIFARAILEASKK